MSNYMTIPKSGSREECYTSLLSQIELLIQGESDTIANLANISALVKEDFGFFWVGFYIVRKNELVLGPFQGTIACTRISYGKGVCGKAWKDAKSIFVPNVELFEGHIACSSLSKSEIVLPIFSNLGEVVAVLDIDSDKIDGFSQVDLIYMEKLANIISNKLNFSNI